MEYKRKREIEISFDVLELVKNALPGIPTNTWSKLAIRQGSESIIYLDGQDVSDEEAELLKNSMESMKIVSDLDKNFEDWDISPRASKCLNRAGILNLRDLISYKKTDLIKFRDFGKMTLNELEDLLESKNLSFKE